MASQHSQTAPNERRERAKKEVKQLIEERNNVLSQYYNLVKHLETLDETSDTYEMLQEFCQELVDYLATGHFELYRRIEEGNERRDKIIKLTDEVMPKITTTTQVAVAFNDLFDKADKVDDSLLSQLPSHLSRLGEHLATRIELEDQIIDALLSGAQRPDLKAVPSTH